MDRARELHRQWRAILATPNYDLDEEQSAYDALIEHLEANDLNYSRWDPRLDPEDQLR